MTTPSPTIGAVETEVLAMAKVIYEAEMAYMLSIPRESLRPLTWAEIMEGDAGFGRDRYIAAARAALGLVKSKLSLAEGALEEISKPFDNEQVIREGGDLAEHWGMELGRVRGIARDTLARLKEGAS